MRILKSIINLLKGERHAERDVQSVFRGGQRKPFILHRIPAVCEQALSDLRDIGMLARACAAERSRDSGTMSEDPIRRESCALIAAAKSVGRFVEKSSVPGTRYTIRTGESEVRLVQKDRQYYKIKNPFAKLHLKKHPIEFVLFEHVVHNIIFPDCRLEFLGVSEECREARFVFKQNAVRSSARPDDCQIAEALRQRGLEQETRYVFGNGAVSVTDVGQDGDNVLLDENGNLRFIDPIIGFKEPLMDAFADMSALENEIDQFVYKLYGLSNDEIKLTKSLHQNI